MPLAIQRRLLTSCSRLPRLAVKFFEPVFTAPLKTLPSAIDFKAQLPADLAAKISYDSEQGLLRFAGIMTNAEQEALNALVPNVLPPDVAYHIAVNSLAAQPQTIAPPDDRIWLTETDIDPTLPANNTLAKRLATAARKGLDYLSKTLAANTVVQQSSAQLGLTEALTRRLLDDFAPHAANTARSSEYQPVGTLNSRFRCHVRSSGLRHAENDLRWLVLGQPCGRHSEEMEAHACRVRKDHRAHRWSATARSHDAALG